MSLYLLGAVTLVRALRTGPTLSESEQLNSAMNRVYPPSTSSS